MGQDVVVSLVENSVFAFPKDNKTTIFQMVLRIENPGPDDIIPMRSDLNVHSPFNWFSLPLHNFKIVCDAAFCILRESTFQETFYFSLHCDIASTEQNAFCEIINDTKPPGDTLKFQNIYFHLSDGRVVDFPVRNITP